MVYSPKKGKKFIFMNNGRAVKGRKSGKSGIFFCFACDSKIRLLFCAFQYSFLLFYALIGCPKKKSRLCPMRSWISSHKKVYLHVFIHWDKIQFVMDKGTFLWDTRCLLFNALLCFTMLSCDFLCFSLLLYAFKLARGA